MTFQQLQYLLAVHRSGSVTQAAKKLYVSYSSVSIAITNLEKELGYPLFIRSRKGLIPTARGEKVLEHARRICQSYELLNTVEHDSKRTLRICGTDNLLYAKAFAQVVSENLTRKDVDIIIQNANADNAHIQLLHNQVDLVLKMQMDVSYGYWEKTLQNMGLHRELLCTIPASIRVGKTHPLYEADRIQLHELEKYTLVDNPQNPITQNTFFNSSMYTDPDKILYASSGNAQRELCRRGLACSICSLPPLEVRKNDDLHYVILEGLNYYMIAVTNPQSPQPPEITRFLQLLRQEIILAYPKK